MLREDFTFWLDKMEAELSCFPCSIAKNLALETRQLLTWNKMQMLIHRGKKKKKKENEEDIKEESQQQTLPSLL